MAQNGKVTPQKKARARRPGESLTPEQIEVAKEAFIAHYARYGNVGTACDKAAISRTTFYRWQEHDETFGFAYEQAKADYCDTLRHEIRRRAHDGVLKPVYQRGEKVGSIREYSDTLLIFEAKARMPEYRDKVDITSGGKTLTAPAGLALADALLVKLSGNPDARDIVARALLDESQRTTES